MSISNQIEAAAALRSLSRAIDGTLAELLDLANRAPDPSQSDAIRAAMERVTAAGRDVSRALVEVHKG
jgi:hypothetical protein